MYYLLFMVGIIFSIISSKKSLPSIKGKDLRDIILYLFLAILAVLAIFRYGVGADYFAYKYLYSRLSDNVYHEIFYGQDNQEIGFRVFGSFIKALGIPYQFYLIIFVLINLYFVYKLCRNYGKNPTLSLFLYFCFYYFVWTFSSLRQGITLAVGVYYLLKFIEKEKNDKKEAIKFALIVVGLSLIHASAIVLLILYFLTKFDFSRKKLIYVSIISFFISIIPVGQIVANMTWLPFASRIIPYITSDISLTNIIDFQSFGRIIFLVFTLWIYNFYSEQSKIDKQIITIYILSLCLYFVFKSSELTAARLSIYGKLLDIIILSNLFFMFRDKVKKIIYGICLLILCSLYFYKELGALEAQSNIVNKKSILMPYTNIFNKEEYKFDDQYLKFLHE
jgi:hypothetical protein